MKRTIAVLAVLMSACGGPAVLPQGWVAGVCEVNAMACDTSTGEAYACVSARWAHLTGCPADGCPVFTEGVGWEVCTRED